MSPLVALSWCLCILTHFAAGQEVRPPASVQAPKEAVSKAAQILSSALSDDDPTVRSLAAQEWGGLGVAGAIPRLRPLLKDHNPYVRIAASASLGRLGDSSGAAVLERMAKARFKALKKESPSPVDELRAIAWDKARAASIRELSKMESSGTVKLLEGLRNDPSGIVRDAAAVALARLGREGEIEQFVGALGSEDADERLAAVRNLSEIATPAVLPVLKQMAQDPVSRVRAAAMRGMGAVGSPDSLTELHQGVRDSELIVRSEAIEALGGLPGPEAAKILREEEPRLPSAYVQLLALRALAVMGEEINLGLAQRSFEQRDADTRFLAIEVVEAAGGGWAVEILVSALDDAQGRVRVRAAAALARVLKKRSAEP